MEEFYRIREHILVNKKNVGEWELFRGLFPPEIYKKMDKDFLQNIVITTETKTEDRVIEILLKTKGITIGELSKKIGISTEKVTEIIKYLKSFDLLEVFSKPINFSQDELERYTRQLKLFSIFGSSYSVQEKIKNAKVVVIGLGGIGGWLVYNLASMGVGHIIGYDHDTVELSNLNRQILYSVNDIGRRKAKIALNRIKQYNPDIRFEVYPYCVTENNYEKCIPKDSDIVVSTVFPVEYWINEYCVKNNIAIIAQGGGKYSPTGVIVMIPHKTGCFDCIKNPIDEWSELSNKIKVRYGNEYTPTTTFSPFISLSSNIMAIEIFKIITGIYEPIHNIFIDPFTWEIKRDQFKLEKNKNCHVCGCLKDHAYNH